MEVKPKLVPLTRPRRAFGPGPRPPPASYRAHPGGGDPRARQQSQNTNVKTCGRDREGVRLVSAPTTHPTGFMTTTSTEKAPPEFYFFCLVLALLTLGKAGVEGTTRSLDEVKRGRKNHGGFFLDSEN